MYHEGTKQSVIDQTNGSQEGLTSLEARSRLEKNGPNAFLSQKKKSAFVKFLLQFKDVMILVLIAAAVVTSVIAIVRKDYMDLVDAGIILAIVVINAVIGTIQ